VNWKTSVGHPFLAFCFFPPFFVSRSPEVLGKAPRSDSFAPLSLSNLIFKTGKDFAPPPISLSSRYKLGEGFFPPGNAEFAFFGTHGPESWDPMEGWENAQRNTLFFGLTGPNPKSRGKDLWFHEVSCPFYFFFSSTPGLKVLGLRCPTDAYSCPPRPSIFAS